MATLKRLLADALLAAQKTPGRIQTLPLRGGLEVQMYVDHNGANHLRLQRRGTMPSATERDTVLRMWPQPLPASRPAWTERSKGSFRWADTTWRPPQPSFGSLGLEVET